ncbi:DNase I-like protein [Cylindrobasidium torrendii FP15055 ss-10]|uniref:DNase I-like protein n=1 Tax=Cylindrobasidium torrendii FP15055 ss-10 TaxID=1314674 RepID=A0A0D7AUS2_9AGAR|nr:DNase I-like protein [Cylindrobasidium torrendii FP15055 ss-10]
MHINQLMRDEKIAILVVSETHLNNESHESVQELFERRLHIINSPDPIHPSNRNGVAVIINRAITNIYGLRTKEIVPGRALMIELNWHNEENLCILGVYAPTVKKENGPFWNELKDFFTRNPNIPKPHVVMGDMNVTEDTIDRLPPRRDFPQAVDAIDSFRVDLQLVDGWRETFPGTLSYTFKSTNTGSKSRLDRIYVPSNMMDRCFDWRIQKPTIETDHEMVTVRIASKASPDVGKGRWAMKPHLTKDAEEGRELQNKLEDLIEGITERTDEYNPQELTNIARKRAKIVIPKIDRDIREIETQIDTFSSRKDTYAPEKTQGLGMPSKEKQ